MASKTNIEWAEYVWNTTTGCTRVSRGCVNCYMFREVEGRLQFQTAGKYVHGTAVTLHPHTLGDMERELVPGKVFVDSMSDLFHEAIPDEFIFEVFEAMARAPWHLYMILTKRDARLAELGPSLPWADHVMMGVSVESAEFAHRLDAVRRSGATRTFASLEPLVGSVLDADGRLDLSGIDYVIACGESGPGAEPMAIEWVREIRDACTKQGSAFHFKQWGEYAHDGEKLGKKEAGRVLDGRLHDDEPDWHKPFMERARLLSLAEQIRRTQSRKITGKPEQPEVTAGDEFG